MTPAYDTGLLGAVLSAMSVVVVFQLFVLQNWLQSIYALATEVEQCLVRTIPGDIERDALRARVPIARQSFPSATVWTMAVALGLLGALSTFIGIELPATPPIVAVAPGVILAASFFIATLATQSAGRRTLCDLDKKLD